MAFIFAPRHALDTAASTTHLTRLMPCSPDTTPCTQLGCPPCGHPKTESLRTLEAVVLAYCRDYRKAAERKHAYWAKHDSFKGAIQAAALSNLPCGKRHPHQRRIPGDALQRAADTLATQGIPDERHVSRSTPSCSRCNRLHTRHWRISRLRHRLSNWRVSRARPRPRLSSCWNSQGRTSPRPSSQHHPQATPTSSVSGIDPGGDRGLPLHLQGPDSALGDCTKSLSWLSDGRFHHASRHRASPHRPYFWNSTNCLGFPSSQGSGSRAFL